MKSIIQLIEKVYFHISNLCGNRYSYRLKGFKTDDLSGDTLVYFSIANNRNTFKVNLKELFNKKEIYTQFSPEDVKKITELAVSDMYIGAAESNDSAHHMATKLKKRFLDGIASNNNVGFKYYGFVSMLYIVTLYTAILLSPNTIKIAGFVEPGGILLFPFTYFIADIISEVYGFSKIRLTIWSSVICLAITTLFLSISLQLEPTANNTLYANYKTIFGSLPKLLLANILAIFVSDFINAYSFLRIKMLTKGSHLWLRSIGSSAIGELAYTVVWIVVFYIGDLPINEMIPFMIQNYLFKFLYGFIAIFPTYFGVYALNKLEATDSENKVHVDELDEVEKNKATQI